MLRLILCFSLVGIFWLQASGGWAQTPPEVLEPYKEYRAALKAGEMDKARKAAKAAFDAAEDGNVDAALRGTLAHNYAKVQEREDPEEAVKYYKKALSLTPSTEEGAIMNAERHVSIGQLYAYNSAFARRNRIAMRKDIVDGLDYIGKQNLLETTFGAEMLTLRALAYNMSGRNDKAIETLDQALAIFESDAHTYNSVLRYHAYLIKGQILNFEEEPIDAALALQVVMQNLEGEVSEDHPFIDAAFRQWLFSRSQISAAGETEKALEAGVCKCWPYDEISRDSAIPIMRVPPIMPSRARESGHVMIRFDVDTRGKPYNIAPIAATSRVFIAPSVKSVEKWQYDVEEVEDIKSLEGIMTKVSFRLTNERGQLIPEPDKLIILDEAGYAASRSEAG